jgi:hypothetical protein
MTAFQRELQGHLDELEDQLEYEYRGMSVLTIALPSEMIRLCEGDGVEPAGGPVRVHRGPVWSYELGERSTSRWLQQQR